MADNVIHYNQDDSNPQTKRFLKAVEARDEASALAAIHHGANIYYEMPVGDGGSLNTLSIAASLGWSDVASELLTRDKRLIDYKVDSERNMNILHGAVQTGIKTDLNNSNPDKDVFDMETNKRGPGNYEKVWDVLTHAKPSLLTERDLYGETPFAIAVKEHDSDFVRHMLKSSHSKEMAEILTQAPVTPTPENLTFSTDIHKRGAAFKAHDDTHHLTPAEGLQDYIHMARDELAKLKGPDGVDHVSGYAGNGWYDARKAERSEAKSEQQIIEMLGAYKDVLRESFQDKEVSAPHSGVKPSLEAGKILK